MAQLLLFRKLHLLVLSSTAKHQNSQYHHILQTDHQSTQGLGFWSCITQEAQTRFRAKMSQRAVLHYNPKYILL